MFSKAAYGGSRSRYIIHGINRPRTLHMDTGLMFNCRIGAMVPSPRYRNSYPLDAVCRTALGVLRTR